MPLDLPPPIIYLITSGQTTATTTPRCNEFIRLLNLIEAAVAAQISLVQLREKNLTARVLYELTLNAVKLTRGSPTRVLVNDRFDIALAAGADGVQLTSQSVSAEVVRETCGDGFLIGVSTHSIEEARRACNQLADFAVFGPVFETESKRAFGPPQGIGKLREVTTDLVAFPIIAIGGVTSINAAQCFHAGASGIAAIRLLANPSTLLKTVDVIKQGFAKRETQNDV